jgi:hypothetical protein
MTANGIEMLLRVLAGDRSVAGEIRAQAREDLERSIFGPIRAYRLANPNREPMSQPAEVLRYVERVLSKGPGITEGFVLGLVDRAADFDQERLGLAPAGASELDWAAVRAERDDLIERLTRRERQEQRAKDEARRAESNARRYREQRDVEARNALELDRRLTEAKHEIMRLHDSLSKIDAELIEARGNEQTLEERLAAEVSGKVEEARK